MSKVAKRKHVSCSMLFQSTTTTTTTNSERQNEFSFATAKLLLGLALKWAQWTCRCTKSSVGMKRAKLASKKDNHDFTRFENLFLLE